MLVLLLLLISRLINGSGLRIPILKFPAQFTHTRGNSQHFYLKFELSNKFYLSDISKLNQEK